MKNIIARLAGAILALALLEGCSQMAIPAHAQAGTPISFTLSWESNTVIDSRFFVHGLKSYNGQPVNYPVCGYSPEGYDIWCGEVVHYAANPATDPTDFNFPDSFLLEGCQQSAAQLSTVYKSPSRRTITVNATYACTDKNGAAWMVQTANKTNQYLASCGRYACWQTFGPGQQVPITGTVTQD